MKRKERVSFTHNAVKNQNPSLFRLKITLTEVVLCAKVYKSVL